MCETIIYLGEETRSIIYLLPQMQRYKCRAQEKVGASWSLREYCGVCKHMQKEILWKRGHFPQIKNQFLLNWNLPPPSFSIPDFP